jgi:uncharacterized protein YndB with AHSA1/START domain
MPEPLREIVNTAIIAAPAEKIFDYIASAERNVEWVPDLTASERVTPGPTRKGTRFRFVMKVAGIPVESVDEVVQFEPGRLIRFAGVRGPKHTGYWRMEPLDPDTEGRPRTRVTYAMTFDLPPALGALVSRLFNLSQRLDEQSRACLANLKRILE